MGGVVWVRWRQVTFAWIGCGMCGCVGDGGSSMLYACCLFCLGGSCGVEKKERRM